VARTSSSELARLVGLLGLTDDETLAIFDLDPVSVISGALEHRPELPILLVLAQDAAEQAGPVGLQRWLRVSGPAGRPIELLLTGDFAGFEDALGGLADRGLILRSTPQGEVARRDPTAAPVPAQTPSDPARAPPAGRPTDVRPPGRHEETGGL
jgi:hypothetical protein